MQLLIAKKVPENESITKVIFKEIPQSPAVTNIQGSNYM